MFARRTDFFESRGIHFLTACSEGSLPCVRPSTTSSRTSTSLVSARTASSCRRWRIRAPTLRSIWKRGTPNVPAVGPSASMLVARYRGHGKCGSYAWAHAELGHYRPKAVAGATHVARARPGLSCKARSLALNPRRNRHAGPEDAVSARFPYPILEPPPFIRDLGRTRCTSSRRERHVSGNRQRGI